MIDRIRETIFQSHPEDLNPPSSLDHAGHVVTLTLAGHPQIAADHLLNPEMRGNLVDVMGNVARQLNLQFLRAGVRPEGSKSEFKKQVLERARIYELMVEIGLNLSGIEPKIIGLSGAECDDAYSIIVQALTTWAEMESKSHDGKQPVGGAVVERMLAEMKKIMKGAGMMAKIAEEVEAKVDPNSPVLSYLQSLRTALRETVYYKISARGMCKLGNDYAIGLRWLRHLGFVQVSTNPVLAAKAYEDDPSLWDEFSKVVQQHREWFGSPGKRGDEIAMEATMVALWPNLAVFRPIALASKFHHGMVSYQLNPNVAHSLDGSLADALKIYSAAARFLEDYDRQLTWGYDPKMERGRPNIVFKVAGGYPAALEITETLNGLGIGTNNTVTYTVAQETPLIIRAISGMAKAVKMGIPITQAYETNMGGRLESHLRDVESERILRQALSKGKDKGNFVEKLAQGLGMKDASGEILERKVSAICSYKYLKSLATPAFVQAIAESGAFGSPDETAKYLSDLERDIGFSGTLVCQRVYWVFFGEENRPRWLNYLQRKFQVTPEQAAEILDKIDMLPASKRKPDDTYLTLANRNMTNTEFPNHQYNVLTTSRKPGFDLSSFENSVMMKHDPRMIQRLLHLEDFRKAYELTPQIQGQIKEAGFSPDFGLGGVRPQDWPKFGSVVKTMDEFKGAYEEFKAATVAYVRKAAERRGRAAR